MSELLTVDQAANFLQVKISTIQNYTKTGKLGFYERENKKLDVEALREEVVQLREKLAVYEAIDGRTA